VENDNAKTKVTRIFDCYTVFGVWPNRPANISSEVLGHTLQRHRVTRAATICAEAILGNCAEGNDQARQVAAADSRLLPVPALNPAQFPHCLAEVERMGQAGLRLFATFPETQDWSPDAITCRLLLEALAKLEAGLMVEATRAETVSRLLCALDGIELPLVLVGVNYRNLGEALAAASRYPRLYLETHLLAPVGALERCCELIGPDRVFFGSGAPLCYFSSAFLRTRFAAIPPQQVYRVLYDNMAALVEALKCPS